MVRRFQDFEADDKKFRLVITNTEFPPLEDYAPDPNEYLPMRVWVAYFWEDLARDDPDGPISGGDPADPKYLFYR